MTLPPHDWVPGLIQNALNTKTVIDVSSNAGLWGGHMRGTSALLMTQGGLEIENSPDAKSACDLVQAHLIETLSSIGREWVDFYFLRVRRGLEEFQIEGALQALAGAKEEGNIRFVGLACEGPGLAVQGVWQFHDAFEVVLVHEIDQGLMWMAQERRVGIVVANAATDEFTNLVSYSSAKEPAAVGACP